jgi:nucleoside-diphosphate-sugar epimerase
MSDRAAIQVTGGAGYIGWHCCRAIVGRRLSSRTTIFSSAHRSFASGSLVTGDLTDKGHERTSLSCNSRIWVHA